MYGRKRGEFRAIWPKLLARKKATTEHRLIQDSMIDWSAKAMYTVALEVYFLPFLTAPRPALRRSSKSSFFFATFFGFTGPPAGAAGFFKPRGSLGSKSFI